MNGYIQIQMNGHPVGLKFGYNAVKSHTIDCELFFQDYYQLDSKGEVVGLTIMGLANLVHAAYKNNQLLKRQLPEIEMEAFYDWLFEQNQTDEGQKVIEQISTAYNESREVKLFIDQMKEAAEDIKKKTQPENLSA